MLTSLLYIFRVVCSLLCLLLRSVCSCHGEITVVCLFVCLFVVVAAVVIVIDQQLQVLLLLLLLLSSLLLLLVLFIIVDAQAALEHREH